MNDLTGGCACGAVRFTATGAPKFAFICQCRSCQHLSGSGNAVQFCHDAAGFSSTGPVAEWARQTDSGQHRYQDVLCDLRVPAVGYHDARA